MPWPVHPTGFFGAQGDQDTYRIERSLRFNSADSAYLNRTPASAGNRKTWTWSGWVKFSSDTDANIFGAGDGSGGDYGVFLKGTNGLQLNVNTSSTNRIIAFTASKIRDFSAWYHFVLAVDTTQATNSNGVKIYINGVQQTLTFNVYTQNVDTAFNNTVQHRIGHLLNAVSYTDGYLTEINFIDGQALTPSSFGETDAITGRWKAKAYSGTYGTNGFYLKFSDNSGTTATTLGKDSSGNGNNWTPNNFSVTAGADNDSLLDSPTNSGTSGNYATFNPLNSASTPANGNLDRSTSAAPAPCYSTIGMISGKWYFEYQISSTNALVGVWGNGGSAMPTGSYPSYYWDIGAGSASSLSLEKTSGTASGTLGNLSANDIYGIALDMDNTTIYFYKNNSLVQTITGMVFEGPLFFVSGSWNSASVASGSANFGQRPFAYTAPTGFKALCTTNLSQPTIQKPSKYMDVVTYTGNGSTQTISGLGFSPDLVWIKSRAVARSHRLLDTIRGVNSVLASDTTGAEYSSGTPLSSFNSNGFSLTNSDDNVNSETYVAWAWDEAPIAGMDIVSYTGNGSVTSRNISHGLGVTPAMIIVKARDASAGSGDWYVKHKSLSSGKNLCLNLTSAEFPVGSDGQLGNLSSSSTFEILAGSSNTNNVNTNNKNYIAYLFAEVEGFSKFGSYTGNGSSDGPFVWCGFRPRYILIKNTYTAGCNWLTYDTARSQWNVVEANIYADNSAREYSFPTDSWMTSRRIDILSNGFKVIGTDNNLNDSTRTHIFCAFAESPFKYARAR